MRTTIPTVIAALALCGGASAAPLLGDEKPPEYPPFDKVADGLERVVSTTDGSEPLWELWCDKKEAKLLAVLPQAFQSQMLMIACTVSGGDPEAGVMGPTLYAKWRKIGKRLALVAPDLAVRTKDQEAKVSVDDLYSDSLIVSAPVASMKDGRPVVDLGALMTQQAGKLFGTDGGGYGPSVPTLDASLASLTKAKAFPENVVVEFEAPRRDGRFVRVTYSIGLLEGTPGFEPREADNRVGYFYDWYSDYSRTGNAEVAERYISRWNIEKADAKLRMSPPKRPLVWYIEHTTPVRYRRHVREGISMWNQAFEKVGIVGAVEVRQQDAASGAYMDIDPEDARYNFFRWNISNATYAIGPSRTNPMTGEILDADVVWHQGLTRSVRNMLEGLSNDIVETSFGPETVAWIEEHPSWDPRVRMAEPARRDQLLRASALEASKAVDHELGGEEHPWTLGARNPTNRACKIGNQLSLDFALGTAVFALPGALESAEETLDGLPEEFVGGMIRYISAHEVGHTLGLQHNMAASTIRSLAEINAEGFSGPTTASVMDYCAVNINHLKDLGPVQGPYASPVLGPYDTWAIRFGYGPAADVEKVLSEVAQPEHVFVSQAAMSVGSDPRNMTWDLGAENLDFCASRLALVRDLRDKLLTEIVDDGEPWSEARRRFSSLLGTHVQALFIASTWVGGSYEHYDRKGDPDGRLPVEDVPAAKQRKALALIVENAFQDDAFGLTPEIVRHLGKEYWWDPAGISELLQDPSFTVHDMVGGIQATALTLLMNPTKLRRVYDNEYRSEEKDELTLAELVGTVTDAVWQGEPTSFRRNLQREHVERLTDLALVDSTSPSLRAIGTLAANELRGIDARCEKAQKGKLDAYASAHLADLRTRIAKALEATYVIPR